jgi:hypothetical protein
MVARQMGLDLDWDVVVVVAAAADVVVPFGYDHHGVDDDCDS